MCLFSLLTPPQLITTKLRGKFGWAQIQVGKHSGLKYNNNNNNKKKKEREREGFIPCCNTMPTNNQLPAGIEHIGHEGYWVGTSWCVHDINDNCWKWWCLKPQNNHSLSQRAHNLSPNSPQPSLARESHLKQGVQSFHNPPTLRSQAIKRCLTSLVL